MQLVFAKQLSVSLTQEVSHTFSRYVDKQNTQVDCTT